MSANDLNFLKEMFYAALFVPEGEPPFPMSIMERPDILKYYVAWGRVDDFGLIVEEEEKPVGAIWSRFFTAAEPGYGFVSEDGPELGIALKEGYRGQGLGSELLRRLLGCLEEEGVKKVSLSVDNRNKAFNLYQRFGFEVYKVDGHSITMLRIIKS